MTASPPYATTPGRRKNMQAIRRADTKPEMAVRRLLHAAGKRYRVDYAPEPALRRRADIVFTRQRVAVFIDGCFWHGCPDHFRSPSANQDYWGPKLARNQERDIETTSRLEAAGWRVMRFWEHEQPGSVAERVILAMTPGKQSER